MTIEEVTADHNAAEFEEGLVNVIPSFATDSESAELMQPADGAFDHPAKDSQATAVSRVSPSEDRLNASPPQLPAMGL